MYGYEFFELKKKLRALLRGWATLKKNMVYISMCVGNIFFRIPSFFKKKTEKSKNINTVTNKEEPLSRFWIIFFVIAFVQCVLSFDKIFYNSVFSMMLKSSIALGVTLKLTAKIISTPQISMTAFSLPLLFFWTDKESKMQYTRASLLKCWVYYSCIKTSKIARIVQIHVGDEEIF